MHKLMLGVAGLALAATAAYADPGKGNGGGGNGGGKGGGQASAPASPGGGGGKGNGGGNGNGGGGMADRGSQKADRTDRGPQADRGGKAQAGKAQGGGNDRTAGNQRKSETRELARSDRGNGKAANANAKIDKATNGNGRADVSRDGVRNVSNDRVDVRSRDNRVVRQIVSYDTGGFRGPIQGCPPGLAKKNNGCTPPGLANDRYRDADYYRPSWFGYSTGDQGRYYYDDGYLYRTGNTGSVLGFIPLLGGALSVGNPWPSYYDPRPVPDYYEQYYNLGSPDSYRYADDVFYRVDPQNDAITSIAALLTGDRFGIGQPMPAGYDVYNVPYDYRDEYYDTPESAYRYADGYVYQVDPTTQLIEAAIQLLT